MTEWSQQEALAFEKEALGFYITGHPLDKYERVLKKITSGTIAALKEKAQSGEVQARWRGFGVTIANTKKGDRYGSFNLEDKSWLHRSDRLAGICTRNALICSAPMIRFTSRAKWRWVRIVFKSSPMK